MFNIKWGGIAAGAAFVLAFTLSLLLGQTSLPIALLRGAIFAALFFGLGIAAWLLINTFIPELLSFSSANTGGDITPSLFGSGNAGSRVNITLDDGESAGLAAALPEQEYGASSGNEVGDIDDLFSPKDIDQTPETGYTEDGEGGGLSPEDVFAPATEGFASETEDFSSAFNDAGLTDSEEEESGEFNMDFNAFIPGGLGGGDGETEDADSDADPFSFLGGGGADTYNEPAVPERTVSRNKPMQLEGDFDAREIAAGLRTVLQKDKK